MWFKNNIPRHSFVCWLACHRRLKTRAKLQRWGLINSASCVFCGGGTEDEEHLFLTCSFSCIIWKGLLIKLGIFRELARTWDEELLWCQNNFKSAGAVNTIKKLCLNNFVYHIWMERYIKDFSTKKMSPDGVSHLITIDIRLKCLDVKISDVDKPYIRRFMGGWGTDCLYKQGKVIACSWLFPGEDEVMVNTDGSRKDESGGSGWQALKGCIN